MKSQNVETKSYGKPASFDKREIGGMAFADNYFDSFLEALEEAGKRRASLEHEGYITEIVKSPYDDKYVVCSMPSFLVLEREISILKRARGDRYGK